MTSKPVVASSSLYDRKGVLLYRFYKDENRIPVPLSQISQFAIDATLAIEDQYFFTHSGFSVSGIARAIRNNFSNSTSLEGGSTITQQLVKNRLLSSEKKFIRKLKELVLAIRVEFNYSKEDILGMYLNQVSYGGTAYGIEAAALKYFDKSAAVLSLSESALLAGLLRAPSHYSPFGRSTDLAFERQRQVLRRMKEEDLISEPQYQEAIDSKLSFADDRVAIKAPHFVMYVRQIMINLYGKERLYKGGLQISSTLDWKLHQKTQKTVSRNISKLFRFRVRNGAALVTNPGTGEILSMVGSANYYNVEREGQVNVVMQLRQPGSSIKPLTYAMSLENGKSPLSMLNDVAVAYEIPDEGAYYPRNNDNIFRGNVTLREALASSFNLPAVNELAQIGVLNYIEKAKTLGINSWNGHNEYRLALTLGSGEVRMIDMAQMYSSFANYGYSVSPNSLLSVKDLQGNSLYRNDCALINKNCFGEQDFSASTAFMISSMLSDNQARSITFGSDSDLYIPDQEVAVKTGTTDYLRDNWTVGYTTEHMVLVWVGNNDGSPMRFVHSGQNGASTIWNNIMQSMLDESRPHRFPVPDGVIKLEVCATTGTLSCESCEKIREEYFVKGSEPTESCK